MPRIVQYMFLHCGKFHLKKMYIYIFFYLYDFIDVLFNQQSSIIILFSKNNLELPFLALIFYYNGK